MSFFMAAYMGAEDREAEDGEAADGEAAHRVAGVGGVW